jgi:hypothetical protein
MQHTKVLIFNRETKDVDIEIDGEYIGTRATYSQAEDYADEYLTQLAELESRCAVKTETEIPPIEVLAATAAELAECAQQAGDRRNMNALNKATMHLYNGVQPTRTTGGWLIGSGTRENAVHRVSDTHGCSCEAASKGFACWHAAMVEIIQVSQERAVIGLRVRVAA